MFLTILALILVYLILVVGIIPYYKTRKYAKFQGVSAYYRPLFGKIWHQLQDLKNHNDVLYSLRRDFAKSDKPKAIATNMKSDFVLSLYDPELTKDFVSKASLYEKDQEFFGLFEDLTGNSILKQEGQSHKQRRAVLSKIFNFNFISNLIPDIIKITHENFDQMEKEYPTLERVPILDTIASITSETIVRMFF